MEKQGCTGGSGHLAARLRCDATCGPRCNAAVCTQANPWARCALAPAPRRHDPQRTGPARLTGLHQTSFAAGRHPGSRRCLQGVAGSSKGHRHPAVRLQRVRHRQCCRAQACSKRRRAPRQRSAGRAAALATSPPLLPAVAANTCADPAPRPQPACWTGLK